MTAASASTTGKLHKDNIVELHRFLSHITRHPGRWTPRGLAIVRAAVPDANISVRVVNGVAFKILGKNGRRRTNTVASGCGLNRSCERRRVSPNGGPSNCHDGAIYEHDTANRRSKIWKRTGRCPRLDDTNYSCPNARESHSDRCHPIEDWLPDFDCPERSRTCHREHEYEHWSTDETRGGMNTMECGHRDERRYRDNAGRHWGYRRSESREGRHVDTRRRGLRHSANGRSRSGVRRVRFRE
ncbi:hypothetical protein BGZ61DRAFT_552406 [Ilyonectria robusta]|uniref:uncharacterized protein n=1 Tax=Ilyonectria robusta TaxID=1079257 RepID=UPI001E8DFE28|nr:uncharacterized protein BGZ61DRAFT_552406 [Ilyonectria robusta]KAH8677019.1 hypothetical protein BGZ61DRAFT_552406 [Ilyonectria robusta]